MIDIARKLRKPMLVVVTAPSGAGKSTLCGKLLAEFPEFLYSVSCTTRPPRGAEVHGVAYYFLSRDEFTACVERGEFLEHALVHGNYYGTLRKTVVAAMEAGRSVLMDIDVCGAAQVRSIVAQLPDGDPMKDGFLDIFINAPSIEVLRFRLVKRGEDSAESIERRLANAAGEIARAGEFSHLVINEDVEAAYLKFRKIIIESAEKV